MDKIQPCWAKGSDNIYRCSECLSPAPYYQDFDSNKYKQQKTNYCPDCGHNMTNSD